MVCRAIWANKKALKGAEADTSCGELAILTMKKPYKEITNRRQPRKAKLLKVPHIFKSKINK